MFLCNKNHYNNLGLIRRTFPQMLLNAKSLRWLFYFILPFSLLQFIDCLMADVLQPYERAC